MWENLACVLVRAQENRVGMKEISTCLARANSAGYLTGKHVSISQFMCSKCGAMLSYPIQRA